MGRAPRPGTPICGVAPPGCSTLPAVRCTPGNADLPAGNRTLPKVGVDGTGVMTPDRFCANNPVAASSAMQNPLRVLMWDKSPCLNCTASRWSKPPGVQLHDILYTS